MRTFGHMTGRCRIAACVIATVAFVVGFPESSRRGAGAEPMPAAATLTVNKLADTNDGVCDADCSLREAIAAAASGDIINFSVAGTIGLTLGQLTIAKNLTIQGPGASILTVSRTSGTFRIFEVIFGVNVVIEGLTVSGGNVGNPGGGGIHNAGILTLTNLVVTGNTSTAENTVSDGGGGIRSTGTLSINNSTISANTATNNVGGIMNVGGTMSLDGSTVSGNSARLIGGIRSQDGGTLNINNSTITGNTTMIGAGGGISTQTSTMTVINSTVSGNIGSAGILGTSSFSTLINSTVSDNRGSNTGGIFVAGNGPGALTLTNCTVTANTGTVSGSVGGVSVGPNITFTSRGSIIAGNTGPATPDVMGTLNSQGYNLIGDTTGSTIAGGSNDILNVNPLLGPLAENGGPTRTHALLSGSPAIDKGSAATPPLTTDQRGFLRPYDDPAIPNAPGGDGSDIGAFEVQPTGGGFEADVAPRANGDGLVLSTDVVQMRRFATGLDTPSTSPNEFQRADCAPLATFGDGLITASDVVQARRYASGLDPLTAAAGPTSAAAAPPLAWANSVLAGPLRFAAQREVWLSSLGLFRPRQLR